MFVSINSEGKINRYSSKAYSGALLLDVPEHLLPYYCYTDEGFKLDSQKFAELPEAEDLSAFDQDILSSDMPLWDAFRVSKVQQTLKHGVRASIREQKDLEDDFADTKQMLHWMLYGLMDIYQVLTVKQKSQLEFAERFAFFAEALDQQASPLRVDMETDQSAKFTQIMQDEACFAQRVKKDYLEPKTRLENKSLVTQKNTENQEEANHE